MMPALPSALDLMQMHVHALYVQDHASRIISVNDWNGGLAPRFFLGRTKEGNIWRFRHDLPEEICVQLENLCHSEPFTISDRPLHEAAYRRILASHSPITRIWLGPAYSFANVFAFASEPILINEQNAFMLQDHFPDWLPDVPHQQPFATLLVDGQPVAVCASVRITDAAHEAGVETLDSQRRKGFGAKVVSAWAGIVKKMGAIPLYSTSIENLASQKLAARLGLTQYGLDFHIT